jgi:ATP/maltotriose-dependent transcriptional regulator MalT
MPPVAPMPSTSWNWQNERIHSSDGGANWHGTSGWRRSTTTCGQRCAGSSTTVARQHHNRAAIAHALGHLGLRAARAGDLTESLHLLQEALHQTEELHDDHQISFTLVALGYRSLVQGEYREAAAFSSASVSRFQAVGNLASATVVQFSLAVALQQLFLSPRTVDHHLTSIFNKLGVETRAQAVAVAAREGLL